MELQQLKDQDLEKEVAQAFESLDWMRKKIEEMKITKGASHERQPT